MSERAVAPTPRWSGAWLERFATSSSAAWGFAEATLFFVVPDVFVGAVGLYRPKKAVASGLAAVGGALVGGAAMYLVGRGVGDDLRQVMDAIPSIRPEMLDEARRDLLDRGGLAMLIAPSQGIPYKLYATEWSLLGWGLPALLAWTIPARAIRIVSFGLMMAGVGVVLRRRIENRPGLWLILYAGSWTIFYLVFWYLLMPARFGSS